jgi:hypothetical protein
MAVTFPRIVFAMAMLIITAALGEMARVFAGKMQ